MRDPQAHFREVFQGQGISLQPGWMQDASEEAIIARIVLNEGQFDNAHTVYQVEMLVDTCLRRFPSPFRASRLSYWSAILSSCGIGWSSCTTGMMREFILKLVSVARSLDAPFSPLAKHLVRLSHKMQSEPVAYAAQHGIDPPTGSPKRVLVDFDLERHEFDEVVVFEELRLQEELEEQFSRLLTPESSRASTPVPVLDSKDKGDKVESVSDVSAPEPDKIPETQKCRRCSSEPPADTARTSLKRKRSLELDRPFKRVELQLSGLRCLD
jgi:hypothetical protein